MRNALRSSFLIVALCAVVPVAFHSEILAGARHCCCRTCRQPCGRCCCPTPTPCMHTAPQAALQRVVETQYAQQPVLQQRDVVATEYRTEPVLETVPATVYENVMVDEGSYQTVWVPRLTTKSVARTTYQSRTAYRSVPYQVTRRVSEYATQTVPYQTVRYVPAGSSLAYGATSGYLAAGIPTYATGAAFAAGTYPTLAAAPIFPTPAAASPSFSSFGSTAGLVPDARFADAPSTPISPRIASNSDRFSESRSADRGPSLFVPAPSAAQVWQARRNSTIR